MNRGLAVTAFAVLALSAAIIGCSTEGTVVVRNESSSTFTGNLEGKKLEIEPGESHSQSVYIGKSIGFVGPNDLEVVLYGSSWTKRGFTELITVTGDETSTYAVIDDVGACYIINNFTTTINSIQIRDCSQSEFDPNHIAEGRSLFPSDGFLLQLDEGCWDIRILYGKNNLPNYMYDFEIDVGEVTYIYWTPY